MLVVGLSYSRALVQPPTTRVWEHSSRFAPTLAINGPWSRLSHIDEHAILIAAMYISLSLDSVDMDRKSTKLKPTHALTIAVQAS